MTKREQEIYELIKRNPMISQETLADTLGITRPSVGVHISNLIKKGHILGKGYLLAHEQTVIVIGGANVDIQGSPDGSFRMHDSNPGSIKTSLGGVGRNIAENLALMGAEVRFISAIGQDRDGDHIRENAHMRGIILEDSLVSQERTSTYLYILDDQGEMVVAVSDMEITKGLTPDFLRSKEALLNQAAYIVVDANLEKETIEYLARQAGGARLILDPVSTVKALRAKDVLGAFYAIKVNRLEAQALLGYSLEDETSLQKAAQAFLEMGVEKVFITLGGGGVYFADKDEQFLAKSEASQVVNVTGAGDAFTAGMVYALSKDLTTREVVSFAQKAAALTLASPATVNPEMTHELS